MKVQENERNMISYMVGNKNNKKEYLKKLIEKNYIKLIEREDM